MKFVLILALLIFSTTAFGLPKVLPPNEPEVKKNAPIAHETTITKTVTPNINQGNIMVAGSYSIGPVGGSTTSYAVNTSYEYFIANRIATGVRVVLASVYGQGTYFTLAPNATFYMWRHEAWAIFGAGDIAWAMDNPGRQNPDLSVRTGFGVSYFFCPQVAFSPSLVLSRNFGPAYDNQGVQGTLSGEFGIFF